MAQRDTVTEKVSTDIRRLVDAAATGRPVPAPDVDLMLGMPALDVLPVVSFAMMQANIPVVTNLMVANAGEQTADGLRLRLSLRCATATDVSAAAEMDLCTIDAGEVVQLAPLTLQLRPESLLGLNEAIPGEFLVELFREGQLVADARASTRVLAHNEFFNRRGIQELLAAHVMPNHPAVVPVLQRASELLKEMTGSPSLDGYQGSAERPVQIARAIFQAIRGVGITYSEPPASFENTGQKIRTPGQVIEERFGTCLDLTCLYGACLEQAGVHAAVYFINGHAYAGLFSTEDDLPDLASLGPEAQDSVVTAEDRGVLVPVETTLLCTGQDADFEHAVSSARTRLATKGALEALITIWRARQAGIRPLPARVVNGGAVTIVVYGEQSAPAVPVLSVNAREPQPKREANAPERIQKWKRELLDLSLRNPLLHIGGRRGTLDALPGDGSLALLGELLASGASITLVPDDDLADLHRARGARSAANIEPELRRQILGERSLLFVGCEKVRYPTRLKGLAQKARLAEEETGTNLLHLAIGTLHWKDPKSGRAVRSPVLLMPIRLRSKGRGQHYEMQIDPTGATSNNFCLLEKLRLTFGLTVPGLAELTSETAATEVDAALTALRDAIAEKQLDMRVDEEAVLGLFQFGKFRMWKDLDEHWKSFLDNPVVRHLVEKPTESFVDAVALPAPESLDREETFCPIPCDGAQLQAVVAAGKGSSFVLEGPPGTGKSQTITNLIANALGQGKRVLFVAEKRAALEVVKRRLEHAGLGPFCLDVHGKDTTLTSLREQLLASLDASCTADHGAWSRNRTELTARADRLRAYPRQLHDRTPTGLSAWDAHQSLLAAGEGQEVAVSTAVLPRCLADRSTLESLLTDLPELALEAEWGPTAPWALASGFRMADLDRERLAEAITSLRTAQEALEGTLSLSLLALINRLCNPTAIGAFAGLLRAATATRLPSREDFDRAADPSWAMLRDAAHQQLTRYRAAAMPLLTTCRPTIVTADLDALLMAAREAAGAFFLFRKSRLRKVGARFGSHWKGTTGPRHDELLPTLERAVVLRQESATLKNAMQAVPGLKLPDNWAPHEDDAVATWEACVGVFNSGAFLRAIDNGPVLDECLAAVRSAPASAYPALAAWLRAWESLLAVLPTDADQLARWSDMRGVLVAVGGALPTWQRDATDARFLLLQRWSRFRERLDALADFGLPEARTSVLQGHITPPLLPAAVRRGIARAARAEQLRHTGLRDFDGLEHDREVRHLLELLEYDASALHDVVPARLVESRPFRAGERYGELGELARNELARKRGGLSIRALMQKYARATAQLTPCMLMSPGSVAQFITPGTIEFDLVVFDEASQIPVAEAIGAMGRGKAVVVVGDSRQMPPTSFFTGSATADDGEVEALEPVLATGPEDLDSILSECVQSGLGQLWLSWHYRSQDESLIAFSNEHYYDGRLSSFPAPLAGVSHLGVRWQHVADGVFDRGESRTNESEARALVDTVVDLLNAKQAGTDSIGIVTLNLQQCTLVQDLLEERSATEPQLEAALQHDEPDRRLFVKNLENVQGDERDVILLSVGFGRDKSGHLTMNFGPLNRVGGERRWNVAVTRARRQVIVFSSITPEDIDIERVGVGAQGVRHLRRYLEAARNGGQSERSVVARGTQRIDHHREQIAAALRAAGLHVEVNVGLSDFKVDLALALPSAPDRRIAAVLLDGPSYASRHTVQDRDVLPAQVLRRLMRWPRTIRVWLPQWLHESERIVRAVVQEVQEAAAGLRESELTPPPSQPHRATGTQAPVWHRTPQPTQAAAGASTLRYSATAEPTSKVTPPRDAEDEVYVAYGSTELIGDKTTLDQASQPRARALITQALAQVLAVESPIEGRRLARLVGRRFDMSRMTGERVATMLGILRPDQRQDDTFGTFVWVDAEQRANWRGFRRPANGASRPIDEIAPEELRNAMVYITRRGISVTEEELYRETAEIFGVGRLTVSIRERLGKVLTRSIADGALLRCGDRITASEG